MRASAYISVKQGRLLMDMTLLLQHSFTVRVNSTSKKKETYNLMGVPLDKGNFYIGFFIRCLCYTPFIHFFFLAFLPKASCFPFTGKPISPVKYKRIINSMIIRNRCNSVFYMIRDVRNSCAADAEMPVAFRSTMPSRPIALSVSALTSRPVPPKLKLSGDRL